MDFEQEPIQVDEERLSVNINILQLASSPPDDLVRSSRPGILRSRRAPVMPVLSSSPSSVPLDTIVVPSISPSVNNTPATSDTNTSSTSSSSQSLCTPPSPPPPKSVGKERKLVTSVLTKEIEHATPSSFHSPSDPTCSSPQLDISDFECPLCFQIYLQPVTTPCGHVFCKQCLFRAIKHSSSCPLCRNKMDSSIHQKYSVNIVLMNIIEKYFPKEHRERASEEEDTQKAEAPLKPGT